MAIDHGASTWEICSAPSLCLGSYDKFASCPAALTKKNLLAKTASLPNPRQRHDIPLPLIRLLARIFNASDALENKGEIAASTPIGSPASTNSFDPSAARSRHPSRKFRCRILVHCRCIFCDRKAEEVIVHTVIII